MLNPAEQLRLYGFNIFNIWFNTYHIFDIGHFLYVKSDNYKESKIGSQVLPTIVIHILSYLLIFIRFQEEITTNKVLTVIISFTILFGLRYIAMLIVAKINKLDVKYRMWESGMLLNALISVLFGGIVPSPGNFYPTEVNWKYADKSRVLGQMAVASSTILVIIISTLKLILINNTTPMLETYLNMAFTLGSAVAVIDVVLPLFPFSPYNGKRVWDYNRLIWLALALLVVSVILV